MLARAAAIRRLGVALVVLALHAPAWAAVPAPLTLGIDPSAETLELACGGHNGTIAPFEKSFLGTCWGHVGHHTYYLERPHALVRGDGSVRAVEAELAGIRGAPALAVEVSLDGRAWTPVAEIPYPAGAEDVRHNLRFSFVTPEPVPFRFLRVHMPPSEQHGLAGFLDHSDLTLRARPLEAPQNPAPPPALLRCEDGVLESFFPSHPCWFGGVDPRNATERPRPRGLHQAPASEGSSYYDSPSFLHTYYLGEAVVTGPFRATAEVLPWRPLNHITSCEDDRFIPPRPVLVAQASPDGRTWTEVARTAPAYGEPAALSGDLPPETRFLRFGVHEDPTWVLPPCHHPLAFLVDSAVGLEPMGRPGA